MAKELVVKTFDPNQLFYKMVEFYQENKKKINPNTGTTQRIDIFVKGLLVAEKLLIFTIYLFSFASNLKKNAI